MDVALAMRVIDAWAEQNNQPVKTDYRDLNIQAGETRQIDAAADLWVMEYADEGLRIESDNGYYDLRNPLLNENQHQHQGLITITNTGNVAQNVTFIVGIGR